MPRVVDRSGTTKRTQEFPRPGYFARWIQTFVKQRLAEEQATRSNQSASVSGRGECAHVPQFRRRRKDIDSGSGILNEQGVPRAEACTSRSHQLAWSTALWREQF